MRFMLTRIEIPRYIFPCYRVSFRKFPAKTLQIKRLGGGKSIELSLCSRVYAANRMV